VPQTTIVGGIFQVTRIVVDSLREFLLLDTRQSAQFVKVGDIRITLDSLRTIVLGTSIIIEVILGYAPVEPRFIEIRFGYDSLIEVLDRQHVVLVIERGTPYGDESVGIELGT
jgi:hypothetical protein